jgi:hypothetical protein
MSIFSDRAGRRSWAVLSAILVVVTVAAGACQSSQATSSAAPALCQHVSSVNEVTMTRLAHNVGTTLHFTFPERITVADAAKAQAVARALCALPPIPHAAVACPAGFNVTYSLRLAGSGGTKFPAVVVQASGCERVVGLGVVRWALRSPGFWSVVGKDFGIVPPNNVAFRGTAAS